MVAVVRRSEADNRVKHSVLQPVFSWGISKVGQVSVTYRRLHDLVTLRTSHVVEDPSTILVQRPLALEADQRGQRFQPAMNVAIDYCATHPLIAVTDAEHDMFFTSA